MKNYFHFRFYSRLLILAVFGLGFWMLIQQVQTKAVINDVADFEISGWAWSPVMGWTSMNCLNDFDGDGELEDSCTGIQYGLHFDLDEDTGARAVKGCAWAGNIGWYICYSDPCVDAGNPACTNASPNGIYINDYYGGGFSPNYNPDYAEPSTILNSLCHTGDPECHPSILFFEDLGDVWTHEIGFPIPDNIDTHLEAQEVNGCFNCYATEDKRCFGGDHDNQSCVITNPDCIGEETSGTCEVFAVDYDCDNCLQFNYNPDTYVLQSVLGGYDCHNCNNFDETVTCKASAYQQNNNTCTCNVVYNTPGVMLDYTMDANNTGSLCGWAWNAYFNPDDSLYYGVGWMQFSPRITTTSQPYFAVEGGNIYSRGNIRSLYPPPFNKYNAYLIETSGDTIYNVFSSNTTTPSLLTNRPLIDYPNLDATFGQLINSLGKIDYFGLKTKTLNSAKNKYGMEVGTAGAFGDPYTGWQTTFTNANAANPFVLNNVVYYRNGPFILSGGSGDTVIDNNGGNGVVILEGDLFIAKNFVYNNDLVSNIDDIASLVWIVKGDVRIDAGVDKIVGTFIILGDGSPEDCSNSDPEAYDACGKFYVSGGGGSSTLVVQGAVFARKFVLNRGLSVAGEPSEKFIDDGRLRINPPAGLTDFVKALPKFNLNQ